MGNAVTKEQKKSPLHRLFMRFQLCPHKPEKLSKSKVESELPPPKPPLRIHSKTQQIDDVQNETGWTDVPLSAVGSPSKTVSVDNISSRTPIPPPRKHKLKIQEILDKRKSAILTQSSPESPKPVEEPLIVAKKVIEHVCDGTHEHVHNVVNGKVVDQIIYRDKSKLTSLHKNASSLSLPSYEELKKKEDKTSSKRTGKKTSASSLPIDKKAKINAAAEKLESYMTRCKSFGSILPNQKPVKTKKSDNEWDKDSDDSWAGLEDWDRQVIENDRSGQTPQPRTLNITDIDQFITSIEHGSHSTPHSGESKRSSSKMSETPINLPIIQNKESLNIADNIMIPKTTSQNYPFKIRADKSVFENDRFFTSEFLKNEAQSGEIISTQKVKLAPLATFDSDREIDLLLQGKKSVAFSLHNDDKGERDPSFKIHGIPEVIKNEKAVHTESVTKKPTVTIQKLDNNKLNDIDVPEITPRRKSSTGHSNLLKFINRSSLKSPIPIENVIKENESFEEISEKQIVPEIRGLEESWQKLVQRDNNHELSSLLELESAASTAPSTSSDSRTLSDT